MTEAANEERPQKRAFGIVQALSSRIPPVRAVAVSSNLYKSHACLQGDHRADFAVALVSLLGAQIGGSGARAGLGSLSRGPDNDAKKPADGK